MQRHYWKTFVNLKRDAIYINRYQAQVERTERGINIFSAVASSSAIALWAVWQRYPLLWAAVIAAAQVLAAVKPHLPYRARLTALSKLGAELEALALAAETDWLKVSRGTMDEDEAYRLAMDLKRKKQQATQRHFKGTSLPEDKRLLAMASRDVSAYMLTFNED